ncbi:hypothetical protein CD120_09205 [Staphylococcus saprophyticus]|uniref:hypothetical protein n=1 Tax=Staphylococcus saprophyticus TaxID=29385 RepID=UPI000CD0CD17|nr:hypothetical protein [Staphylococcus saprophyticus]PNZ69821.1 hypothetical protein CD120_09205 [Staphylococcus saprophyticus]
MNNTVKDYEKLSEQYNKMIAERNSLIDDLSWYKAKVSRLERENHDFKKRNALLMNTVDDLDKENKALRLQSNIYFDELQESEKQRSEFVTMLNESNNLLSEFSQHVGNKPSSSTYKYFRAKLDELGIKEGE